MSCDEVLWELKWKYIYSVIYRANFKDYVKAFKFLLDLLPLLVIWWLRHGFDIYLVVVVSMRDNSNYYVK